MDGSNLHDAIESLRQREGTATKRIGVWRSGDNAPRLIPGLPDWTSARCSDAVISTALPPKFQGDNERIPSVDEVLDYLRSLSEEYRQRAEEYVRKAPSQVRTPYRKEFERHLEWFPM